MEAVAAAADCEASVEVTFCPTTLEINVCRSKNPREESSHVFTFSANETRGRGYKRGAPGTCSQHTFHAAAGRC